MTEHLVWMNRFVAQSHMDTARNDLLLDGEGDTGFNATGTCETEGDYDMEVLEEADIGSGIITGESNHGQQLENARLVKFITPDAGNLRCVTTVRSDVVEVHETRTVTHAPSESRVVGQLEKSYGCSTLCLSYCHYMHLRGLRDPLVDQLGRFYLTVAILLYGCVRHAMC